MILAAPQIKVPGFSNSGTFAFLINMMGLLFFVALGGLSSFFIR